VDQASEWTDQKQMQFENHKELMPWFSVYHPSLISKAVVWFIHNEWKYKNKPILVVLDPEGRVACPVFFPVKRNTINFFPSTRSQYFFANY